MGTESQPTGDEAANQAASKPSLGATAASDVQALKADLEKARHELLGKSCELSSVKELFEKARKHLIQLQIHVTQLRDERHDLANRAMEVDALKRKNDQLTVERDYLRRELAATQAVQRWQG